MATTQTPNNPYDDKGKEQPLTGSDDPPQGGSSAGSNPYNSTAGGTNSDSGQGYNTNTRGMPVSYNGGNPATQEPGNVSSTGSGGSGSDAASPAEDRQNVKRDEEAGEGNGAQSEVPAEERGMAAQVGRGYKPEGKKGKDSTPRFSIKRVGRRSIATIGIIAAIGGGGFMALTVGSGVGNAINLSQILQRPLKGSEDASSTRIGGLYRAYKTGNFGETRLNSLESKINTRVQARLGASGYSLDKTNSTQLRGIVIEPNEKNGFSTTDINKAKAQIAEMFERPIGDLKIDPDGRIVVPNDPFKVTATNRLYGKLINENYGRGVTALAARIVGVKFLNAPGLYSPIKKAEAKATAYLEARAAQRERTGKITQRSEAAMAKAKELRAKLEKAGALKPTAATIAAQGVVCIVRDVAGEVATINRSNVVEPALKGMIYSTAVGSQAQSGNNLTIEQVGQYTQGLYDDDGNGPYGSAGIKALSGQSGGVPVKPEYRQAFTGGGDAEDIRNKIDELGGDAVCSRLALIGGAVIGVALLATGGGGVISKSVQLAGGAVLIAALTTLLPKVIADDSPIGNLEGFDGGNLRAYAAKEHANIVSRTFGGVPLTGAQVAELHRDQEAEETQEFNSRSFYARIFDTSDYRSLAARVNQQTGPNPGKNLATMLGNSVSAGKQFRGLSMLLFPKLSAATTEEYDWGFPEYGFSKEDLARPLVQNPYANASEVEKILNNDGKRDTYTKKAKKCFGVKIDKGENGWDAYAEEDVNPNEGVHKNAGCADSDDEWLRMRMFIFDSRVAESVACYELGEEGEDSCNKLAVPGGKQGSAEPQAGGEVAVATGTQKELAQKLQDYKKEGKYNCDNKKDCEDIDLMVEGKSIAGGVGCTATALDKRTMQILIYLIDKNYKIGTFALCRAHKPGSQHSLGQALDISSINGKNLSSDPSSKSLTLEVNKIIFDLKGELAPAQIITAGVGSTNKVDPDFVKYNRVTPGNEGASAVAAFGSGTMNGHDDHIHVGY